MHGENQSSPSDQQFQLFARLLPDALRRLRAAKNFEIAENHVFHRLSIFVPAGAAVCSKRTRSWFAHLNRPGWAVRGDSYRLPILDPASVAYKFGRESAGQSREAR